MHVRLVTHPNKTITFTSPHGVIVTMPIDVECTDPTEIEFDLPALASISVVGEIASVGPVNEAPLGEKAEPTAAVLRVGFANCGQPIVFKPFFLDGRLPNPPCWWHEEAGFTCPVSGVDPDKPWPMATPPAAKED